MFKPHTVLGFGLWLVAVSFLGIPSSWKIKLYVFTGAVFLFIYLHHLVSETIVKLAGQRAREVDTFVENGSPKSEQKPDSPKGSL